MNFGPILHQFYGMTHILSHNLGLCNSIYGSSAKLAMSKLFFSLNFDPIKNSSRGYACMVNVNISTRGNTFRNCFEGGKKFAQS